MHFQEEINQSESTINNQSLPFDAGIHSSAAWTEHLERSSISDTGDNVARNISASEGTPARALDHFDGDPESSELSVRAGEELIILMENVMDGWSLAQRNGALSSDIGAMGLLPMTHYTLTSELELSSAVLQAKSESAHSSMPRPSTNAPSADESSETTQATAPLPPIELQPTGASSTLSGIRNLMGGRSLNRFSSFVSSGAEDWVLHGSPDIAQSSSHGRDASDESQSSQEEVSSSNIPTMRPKLKESELYYVETPPAWKEKTPRFSILVHTPSKRASTLTGAYIMYSVTSIFSSPSALHITVQRRFSHFTFLHAVLSRRLPGIALPPLPEKQYSGRFNVDFVEARRGDLERWLARIIRHPLARYADVLTFFLGCEDEMEWKRRFPQFLTESPTPGPTFYSHVFHPEFNVDSEEAEETVDRFERHLYHVNKGVQDLREVFARVRESNVDTSTVHRAFSYSLLSLITSPISTLDFHDHLLSPNLPASKEEETETDIIDKQQCIDGILNKDGAWCWREDCEECLDLTKALQKTAESLQTVADLFDGHARRRQLATHEALKDVAHPDEIYSNVVGIHRPAVARYNEALDHKDPENVDTASRCETVLNTTMAEFDTYHTQKNDDFRKLTVEHLDGEIELYEQILMRLRAARSAFDEAPDPSILHPGPRQPSIYERGLSRISGRHQKLASDPLTYPAPHVFDSRSSGFSMGVRPVTQVAKDGVGLLFGAASSIAASPGAPPARGLPSATVAHPQPSLPERKGSVLGRFW